MKQTYKIVLLLTENESNLFLSDNNDLTLKEDYRGLDGQQYAQHLYILSNEEIKGDDFVYFKFFSKNGVLNRQVMQNVYGELGSVIGSKEFIKENCLKVIASTDKLITLNSFIDDTFVKDYVYAYNGGNQIKEINLEVKPYNEGDHITREDGSVIVSLKETESGSTKKILACDNINRYFIVVYIGTTIKGQATGQTSFQTKNNSYLSRTITISQIIEMNKKTGVSIYDVVITNIIELNEVDYNTYLKN